MSTGVAERVANPPIPLTPALIDEWLAEAEVCALRRLTALTASEDERVALKASAEILRYARQQRRARAEPPVGPKAEPSKPAEVVKTTPRPAPAPRDFASSPKPAGAFRAVPDLPPEKLAALLPEG